MKRYDYLLRVCEELNDQFKAEGSRDRAIIIRKNKRYKIAILRVKED